MSDYNIYWGETHHNTFVPNDPDPDLKGKMEEIARYLDFYAAAYYPMVFPMAPVLPEAGLDPKFKGTHCEDWKDDETLARDWAKVNEATKALNAPGEFVTFPGFEWHGNGHHGDHNVSFFEEGEDFIKVDTLTELYKALEGKNALAIPHHTSYMTGQRAPIWGDCNTDLSPFAELYSVHGCSETGEDCMPMRKNTHMGPGISGSTYADALNAGLHIGAICSTDSFSNHNPWNAGIMACLAEQLDREHIWKAFKARRVYGVTGDRIRLNFTVNDGVMGSIIEADGDRLVNVEVEGWDALDRVEVLRNNRVIFTHCHQDTWEVPPPAVRTRFIVRIENGWGPKPHELPLPETPWDCRLQITGSRFLGYMPAWTRGDQVPPTIKTDNAEYTMLNSPVGLYHSANAFEIETVSDADMVIEINGKKETAKVADFCAGSRLMYFRDEAVSRFKEFTGVTPGDVAREDPFYHTARKTKIHRMIPESGFKVAFDLEDDEPLEGETHYRIRVEQRNGQRAWSSPIWVKPKE